MGLIIDINVRFGNVAITTVITAGRRRVGKTRLLNEAFRESDVKFLYLFISRKTESSLVQEFASIIESELGAKFFHPQSLKEVFEYLFELSNHAP